MKHEDGKAPAIVVECDLPEPPAKVWRALTVPELLAAWLTSDDAGPEARRRFQAHSRVAAHSTAGAGAAAGDHSVEREAPVQCELLEAEPHRRLRYKWREIEDADAGRQRVLDSIVTFELVETATGGTHLRVVHDGFTLGVRVPLATPADSEPAGAATVNTHRLTTRMSAAGVIPGRGKPRVSRVRPLGRRRAMRIVNGPLMYLKRAA